VPANELIRRTIKSQEDDPRMPAILEDDAWSTWLTARLRAARQAIPIAERGLCELSVETI
jgi:hypothetical protein